MSSVAKSEPSAGDPVLTRVTVDDRIVEFAVDPNSPDPIAHALTRGDFPRDAVNDLWRHLVAPQLVVLDVGAHLGTYSLPAAAAGAIVIAVEASRANAALLQCAAERNGFVNLDVVCAAAADQAGNVAFKALGPWGHVIFAGEPEEGQTVANVTAVALDDVLQAHACERVDFIKIDVEGSELAALAGLKQVLGRDDGPPLLIEANGHMLHQYGHVPGDVLAVLEGHGYTCHQIDPGSSKRLVPVCSTDLQAECVADYLAFKAMPKRLVEPWWFDQPFSHAEVIRRVLTTCQDENPAQREYGLRLLTAGPSWLLEDESVKSMRRIAEESR